MFRGPLYLGEDFMAASAGADTVSYVSVDVVSICITSDKPRTVEIGTPWYKSYGSVQETIFSNSSQLRGFLVRFYGASFPNHTLMTGVLRVHSTIELQNTSSNPT